MRLVVLCACLAFFGLAFAQQAPDEPRFDVASIKPSDPDPANSMFVGMSADGAMVKYTNITLRDCIRGAYRVRNFQIVGPAWMTKSRFEIDARLPPGATTDQIPDMLRALLVERFKLRIRRDMKVQNVYALVVGTGGAKLKPAQAKAEDNGPKALGPDGKPRDLMMYGYAPEHASITAPSASFASLVVLMSIFTARPVVDFTGIEGQYEFKLVFAPDGDPGMESTYPRGPDGAPATFEAAPSVFDAVKQYGLRLEPRKAPIEMITVTHVERTPTDN